MTATRTPRKKGNSSVDPKYFKKRKHKTGIPRDGDARSAYDRDKARILHSAAFRRLQGKTQVMGVGEGDFHRTRLTHSIECAQIGGSLRDKLKKETKEKEKTEAKYKEALKWFPSKSLIEAACFAHDFGHPPFGHKGEQTLYKIMYDSGGFEGNAQTLRILCRLEKYKRTNFGIDPTRRLILAVLKYPIMYEDFDLKKYKKDPPKCYYNTEKKIVKWALRGFSDEDKRNISLPDGKGKAQHKTLDCSIMELADDIAYGVHDIEDIIARDLVARDKFLDRFKDACADTNFFRRDSKDTRDPENIVDDLYKNSFTRKQIIGDLVDAFMSKVYLDDVKNNSFDHVILKYNAKLPDELYEILRNLKQICYDFAISRPQSKQLERKGAYIVEKVFSELCNDPELINQDESDWPGGPHEKRRVCDYIAGMTDSYIENLYRRLFVPGFGNSADKM